MEPSLWHWLHQKRPRPRSDDAWQLLMIEKGFVQRIRSHRGRVARQSAKSGRDEDDPGWENAIRTIEDAA